jgi:acyl-CoA synthetase (AMP-forming)/AMP-acid ligase II/1-acyl-sn-glycerol-3-phosphate acyltransferase/acyl carrier protein
MFLVRYLAWLLARVIVSLRYRVRVEGIDQVRGLKGPVLVLPNHPAYMDPTLVLVALWPALRPRPLQYEGYFRNPVLYPLMKLLGAVPVPDLERASVQARERTEQTLAAVIEGLKRRECFVLWPAGHIQHDGSEHLGGSRAAADILQAVAEAEVVLVRSRGLWGSMFSYAATGKKPRLIRKLGRGVALLLSNLLVLMPRRPVTMVVEHVSRDRLPPPRREVLNPWLEKWYNQQGPEAPTFVPYHFLFGRRSYEFPAHPGSAEVDLGRITPETRTAIAEILAGKLHRPLTADEQKPSTTLDQLGLDSLDRMEVTLAVEQQFGFHGDEVPANLGQLWALAQGLAERAPPKPPPAEWFRPLSDEGALEILGETIAEAFVARALANPREVAVADDLAGALTYQQLLASALALSRRLAALPAAHVGLLLPASVACDLAFLGLHLAGKLPVLLNWTTGPANLAHAARLMELTQVVTSRPFIDRSGVTVEGVEYLFLEDLRQQIGRLELLRSLLTVRLLPGRVWNQVPRVPADQPAMVLFTSGSERAPKAVPLSHANITSEMRAGIPFLGLTRRESLLGFLPAFHSFGIVATVLLPVLGGMRVVYHADPTDAAGLVRKIAGYRPTLLLGTPAFIGYIVDRSEPGELESLRLIVVGAEKPPASLAGRCQRAAPQASLVEGYGITECSLVVAVNRPEANRPGTVGQPLPGIDVRVVDLESEEELPANRTGMLWVSGPTIFPGYLGYDGPSPFRERQGKRWYVTGDLAEIDGDGFIRLVGRLKRFLKAGGEMISLPALEEPFARLYPATDEGPRVAVEGVETERGRHIVLFTTEPIDLAEANAVLLREGLRGVMRLDEVRHMDKIPLLGTGKVDYKVLRARIAEEKQAKAASAS